MPFHRPIPEPQARGKRSGALDTLVQAEKLMQIALVLPCAAFIGWVAGVALDHWLHQHWIYVAGIVFGGASGLYYVVRLALAAGNAPDGDPSDGSGAGQGKPGSQL